MSYDVIKVSALPETTPDESQDIVIGDGDYLKRISYEAVKADMVGTEPIYTTESEPYLSRATANAGAIGKIALEKIIGGTVAWNQLITFSFTTRESHGVTCTDNGDGSISCSGTSSGNSYFNIGATLTTLLDHVLYICGCPAGGSSSKYYWRDGYNGTSSDWDTGNGNIIKGRANFVGQIQIANGINSTGLVFKPQMFDLTQMFGATIANYIYNLESATAGAGIAKLKEWGFFTDSYYAYNAGELKHVEATSHDTTGKNLFIAQAYSGLGYNNAIGTTATLTEASVTMTGNTISYAVSSWGGYCFKTASLPAGSYTVNVNATSVTNLRLSVYTVGSDNQTKSVTNSTSAGTVTRTVTLDSGDYIVIWIGSNTAQTITISNLQAEIGSTATDYEAYVKRSYSLDSDLVLRGFLKLDTDNNLDYDGDTYEPNGKVTRKYAAVDLGTLTWEEYSTVGGFRTTLPSAIYSTGYSNATAAPMICGIYQTVKFYSGGTYMENTEDSIAFAYGSGSKLVVKDASYSTVSDFTTALSGVYLVYLLATETTESADPYQRIQSVDADGTESFTTTSITPVGHETKIPENILAALGWLGE